MIQIPRIHNYLYNNDPAGLGGWGNETCFFFLLRRSVWLGIHDLGAGMSQDCGKWIIYDKFNKWVIEPQR